VLRIWDHTIHEITLSSTKEVLRAADSRILEGALRFHGERVAARAS